MYFTSCTLMPLERRRLISPIAVSWDTSFRLYFVLPISNKTLQFSIARHGMYLSWVPFKRGGAVISVRFEVGVSLLLAPARADKRGLGAPFPLVGYAGIQPAICNRVPARAPAGAGSYWKHWGWVGWRKCDKTASGKKSLRSALFMNVNVTI